ncbi:MAG: undecaprenyl-diphosphate phosphatase [bacterium]
MNDIVKAVILGIVEGVTEFLPVSSTGHLILVNQYISFSERFTKMFDIVIQLGAILSVIVFFRSRILPFGKKSLVERDKIFDIWKKTIMGVIPALFIGALFKKQIEELLFNPVTVAVALVIGGIALILLEGRKTCDKIQTIENLNYKTSFLIGLIQCLAMIPGTSRSGATIIGAMLLGCSRIVAVEFSFYLAIPTIAAASAYSFLKAGMVLSSSELVSLSVGFIVSFLVAWIVIAGFMNFISKRDFKLFGYYRIILGGIVILSFLTKR